MEGSIMSQRSGERTAPDRRIAQDPVNQHLFEREAREGLAQFGLMTSDVWRGDPRRMAFFLSRYKFVSKMFRGRRKVLEIGCGDGFGAWVVRQEVPEVTAVDIEPMFITDARARAPEADEVTYKVHDILETPVEGGFDGVYSLDVLEHIDQTDEDRFLANMAASLNPHGAAIVGMPSLESQDYASPQSKAGHINCKSGGDFIDVMQRHFHQVFLFSMNDEVVHTGFDKMAHYLIALCCEPKR